MARSIGQILPQSMNCTNSIHKRRVVFPFLLHNRVTAWINPTLTLVKH